MTSHRRATVLATALATFLLVVPASAAPEQTEIIVVLNPTDRPVPAVAQDVAQAHSAQVGFVYTTALQGFTLTLPEQAVAGVAANPNVAYIEPMQEVYATGTQPIPEGIDRIDGDINPPTVPMDGVELAVLDTGVYIGTNEDGSARSHLDLNLRWVSDCTGATLYPLIGGCSGSGNFQDGHGHGTHVAGIAGAKDNDIGSVGVAPGVTLWSFKVLQDDGTGTLGMILAGIDAVASEADNIDVANMSLGFEGSSQAIDDALANAKAAGVVFVVAAGNSGIDAAGFSPASSPSVVTVSALADFDGLPGGLGAATCRSDVDDTIADFSNYGPLVEIAAPGVCIFSTDLNDGYSLKSGTSMASPFVAGAMARYIAETGAPTNDADDVDAIVAAVLGSAVPQTSACGFSDIDSSPEPLLSVNGAAYGGDGTCNGAGAPPSPPANNPPTADFSHGCTDLDCTFTDLSVDSDGTVTSWDWDFGDGNTSTQQNPSHSYTSDGTFTVTLTATDDDGDTGSMSHDVVATVEPPPPPANNPPTADFSHGCTDLDCTFTDLSVDSDGTVTSWDWDFGDGNTSTQQNPSHSYTSDGTFTVTLTATDDDGDTGSMSHDVTVSAAASALTASVPPFLMVDDRTAEIPISVFTVDTGEWVGGATVEGVWTYLDRRGRAKTTTASTVSLAEPEAGALGNAVIRQRFPKGVDVTQFCVTSVAADGYEYVEAPSTCAGEYALEYTTGVH